MSSGEIENSRRRALKDLTACVVLAAAAPAAFGQKRDSSSANPESLPNPATEYALPPFPPQSQEWPGLMPVSGTRGSVSLDEHVQALKVRHRLGDRDRMRVFGKRDQFAAELEYLAKCILDDRAPEPAGAEGLADVRIIEAMQRSIKSGRWVDVGSTQRTHRPTKKQNIRRPPVPHEPELVDAKPSSQ